MWPGCFNKMVVNLSHFIDKGKKDFKTYTLLVEFDRDCNVTMIKDLKIPFC